MSYAAIPIADEYPFKRFFVYSACLHLALSALMLGSVTRPAGKPSNRLIAVLLDVPQDRLP